MLPIANSFFKFTLFIEWLSYVFAITTFEWKGIDKDDDDVVLVGECEMSFRIKVCKMKILLMYPNIFIFLNEIKFS